MSKGKIKRVLFIAVASICIIGSAITSNKQYVYAKETNENVDVACYEFDKNSKYEISETKSTKNVKIRLGELSLIGDMKSVADVNGVKTYSVNDGNVNINYSISDVLVNAGNTQWHLVNDKSKNVDGMKLEHDILSGAIIVQTSLTGESWITDSIKTDIANPETEFDELIYSSKDIQQVNGCYYRIIVVYDTEKQIEDKKMLFWNVDNYEETKRAEVYTFYLINDEENSNGMTSENAEPRKELGTKINTGKDNGFSGNETITEKDPHYGWDIGTFFVNGYTRETSEDGHQFFLKNVGDRVTLWFNLSQDINCLNGNEKLTINEDVNGYDQDFEIEKTNFKHGTLIIRYTENGKMKGEPIIYEDFLAASTRTGANTKVELFEEGDYEVALNYEIKDERGIGSKITNYRIFFTFKIRNGNCMVYPFDVVTGAELADNSFTENGFKLDMAKSRYLIIDVKKEVVKQGESGFTKDVRFNRPAKDGDTFTEEGIYTFTVKNQYTDSETTKIIYVGSSSIIRALASGLQLEEINHLISEGAELLEDGTLSIEVNDSNNQIEESTEDKAEKEIEEITDNNSENTSNKELSTEDETTDTVSSNDTNVDDRNHNTAVLVVGLVILTIVLGIFVAKSKKKKQMEINEDKEGDKK